MKTTQQKPQTKRLGQIKEPVSTEEDFLSLWNDPHRLYLNTSHSYCRHFSGSFTWYWSALLSDSVCGCSWCCINFRDDGWPYAWRIIAGSQKEEGPAMQRRAEISHHGERERETKGMAGCLCIWVHSLGLAEWRQTSEQIYLTKSTWGRRWQSWIIISEAFSFFSYRSETPESLFTELLYFLFLKQSWHTV